MANKRLSYSGFTKKVKDTIKRYDMVRGDENILVAVSGGADSMCLLRVLMSMRAGFNLNIIVANLDHGLRGEESRRESRFVKDFCERTGIKCVQKKVKIASGKQSIEEKAREERYKFFLSVAKKNKCGLIATGHTMDDQAETVFMRILYGASFRGVGGIPPVREDGEVRIIRPLIRVSRKDIVDFLESSGVEHIEDSSNKDNKFRRNQVRNDILPFLEKYNPRIKRTLTNLSDEVREEVLFSDFRKKNILKDFKDKNSVKLALILMCTKSVRKDILKMLFIQSGGNVKKLTYRHWIEMDYFLRQAEKGKVLSLPGKVEIRKKRDAVIFVKEK